ncbi:hypothetical protein A2V68_00630 [candidate division Kazan bacterium RBG_13_50_9]|uniref:Glycosyl transferase family 1 n=1 Tax=candidate division Kazan bacterium RBG_13_50_9 TaxID=1798535 RepID=A0A1F4NSK7_UNCK3|nr:MAG: hypothetical protein A2V68_00630 [candidate division Kazan bacterium RBG_13_50_9]
MQPSKDQTYRIGIDARMFGTAHAAGIGQYAEELIGNVVRQDTDNQYRVFVAPAASVGFPIYGPNLEKVVASFRHYTYGEQFLYPAVLVKAGLDLIHYTNFNSPVFFTRIPSIVTIHDLTLWFFAGRTHRGWLKKALYRFVVRRACQNAKGIIAITKATRDDIVRVLGIPASKITVIYEAVAKRYRPISNPERLSALKHKFNIAKPYALYVGQWRDHKNLVRLIRAFGLLRRRYHLDYQLVLAGKIDNRYPQVPDTIRELGLKDEVVLAGYVADTDLPYLYNGAEFFVFPSLYEGFGLPPLEAMACGTPVVSSNVSCMPEVLGDAAYYFDPRKVEAMAKTMAEVAKSYALKRSLKLKGLRQVRQYSFEKMARQTIKLYHRVLEAN